MCPALVCDRLCNQSLARPRRTVEKNAFGRLNAEFIEEFGMTQGHLDGLADVLKFGLESADILV